MKRLLIQHYVWTYRRSKFPPCACRFFDTLALGQRGRAFYGGSAAAPKALDEVTEVNDRRLLESSSNGPNVNCSTAKEALGWRRSSLDEPVNFRTAVPPAEQPLLESLHSTHGDMPVTRLQHGRLNPTGKYDINQQQQTPVVDSSLAPFGRLSDTPLDVLSNNEDTGQREAFNPTGKYSSKGSKKLRFSRLLSEGLDKLVLQPDLAPELSLNISTEQDQLVQKMLQGKNVYFTGKVF